MALGAQGADFLVVSANTDTGLGLFVIDTQSEGAVIHGYPLVDGTRAADIELHDVTPSLRLDTPELSAEHLLQAVEHDALLAICAEAVGAMHMLYQDTVEYTKEREQFGHPLSDFQVLQHRMVEMFMEYEQCRSLLYRATLEAAQGDTPEAQRCVHALKHLIGRMGIFIGENAVQLHGGMGMTEELRIGHYFKRLLVIDAQFGNADYHLHRFAA